jgi:hypothetical protein
MQSGPNLTAPVTTTGRRTAIPSLENEMDCDSNSNDHRNNNYGPNPDPSTWVPYYNNCLQYFVAVAQHTVPVQALAAYVNISLPFQREQQDYHSLLGRGSNNNPTRGNQLRSLFSTFSSSSASSVSPLANRANHPLRTGNNPSGNTRLTAEESSLLTPYIRRLVVTATDTPTNLSKLFGPEWSTGIGGILAEERINYLFAAKSAGWLATKAQYDILPYETVPFLSPLRDPQEEEIQVAEARWSDWLAFGDWMIGSRSPW